MLLNSTSSFILFLGTQHSLDRYYRYLAFMAQSDKKKWRELVVQVRVANNVSQYLAQGSPTFFFFWH